MQPQQAKEILSQVREDYDKIAPHFSQTRAKGWPEFKKFEKYIRPGIHVLDLGCGNGRLYNFLKNFQIKYLGMDNSRGLLAEARRLHPEAAFVSGDLLNIPASSDSFDLVFCIASLHHIPSDPLRLRAAREIHRVLKKKGLLIMTNWNLFQDQFKKYFKENGLDENDILIPWKDPSGRKKADRYYHAFTPKELKSLAKKAGFKIRRQGLSDEKKNIVSLWQK